MVSVVVNIRERVFLLREAYRTVRGGYHQSGLFEEYLLKRLNDGAYQEKDKQLVLRYLLAECARNLHYSGARGVRVELVLIELLSRYQGEIALDRLKEPGRRALKQWAGLAKFPWISRRLVQVD